MDESIKEGSKGSSKEDESANTSLQLPDDVETLKKIIQQKDSNLNRAGQFGKQLLEANTQLTDNLENVRNQARSKAEQMEQEIYELQNKVDRNKMMEESYREEIELLKTQNERIKEETKLACESKYNKTTQELKTKVEYFQDEIETCRLSERQAKDEAKLLQETLADVRRQLEERMQTLNQTCSEEMAALTMQNNKLSHDNAGLANELRNVNAQLEKLHLQVSKSARSDESKEQQIEQLQCENTSYFNALEKSRVHIQELNVQLDTLMMEKQQHNKKGNSLFSEVEDRRVAAEKEVCVLKGRVQMLDEQYTEAKKHVLSLKFQIAGLLQMSSGRVEEEHVLWLQNELSRSQQELKQLSQKIAEREEKNSSVQSETLVAALKEKRSADYGEFVKNLLDKKDEEAKQIKEELSTKSMYLTAETMRVHEIEGKLYQMQRQRDELNAKCVKQRLTIEELRLKYEPENLNYKPQARRLVVEPKSQPLVKKSAVKSLDGDNKDSKDNLFVFTEEEIQEMAASVKSESVDPSKLSRGKKKSVTLAEKVDIIPDRDESLSMSHDLSGVDQERHEDDEEGKRQRKMPRGKKTHIITDVVEEAENVGQCKQQ